MLLLRPRLLLEHRLHTQRSYRTQTERFEVESLGEPIINIAPDCSLEDNQMEKNTKVMTAASPPELGDPIGKRKLY